MHVCMFVCVPPQEKYSLEEWAEIQTSLDANHNLMSFDIVSDVSDDLCAPPTCFVEYISLNKRLGRINIDLYLSSSQDKYSSELCVYIGYVCEPQYIRSPWSAFVLMYIYTVYPV